METYLFVAVIFFFLVSIYLNREIRPDFGVEVVQMLLGLFAVGVYQQTSTNLPWLFLSATIVMFLIMHLIIKSCWIRKKYLPVSNISPNKEIQVFFLAEYRDFSCKVYLGTITWQWLARHGLTIKCGLILKSRLVADWFAVGYFGKRGASLKLISDVDAPYGDFIGLTRKDFSSLQSLLPDDRVILSQLRDYLDRQLGLKSALGM